MGNAHGDLQALPKCARVRDISPHSARNQVLETVHQFLGILSDSNADMHTSQGWRAIGTTVARTFCAPRASKCLAVLQEELRMSVSKYPPARMRQVRGDGVTGAHVALGSGIPYRHAACA